MGSVVALFLFLHRELDVVGINVLGACGYPIATWLGLTWERVLGAEGKELECERHRKLAELSFLKPLPANRHMTSERSVYLLLQRNCREYD